MPLTASKELPILLLKPVFLQIQSTGSAVSLLRIVGSSIDHADQIDEIPEIDSTGRPVYPKKHDISFDHVDFSYDKRPILKNVNVTIPDRTTTAIIGPGGYGKTTLCSLIARFRDVDSGSFRIGCTDIREYTLESLIDQILVLSVIKIEPNG